MFTTLFDTIFTYSVLTFCLLLIAGATIYPGLTFTLGILIFLGVIAYELWDNAH
jgi:hypothetical protein